MTAVSGRESSEERRDLVIAAHHEIGNYLAAVRFAAELWSETSSGTSSALSPAHSADRAARQAGLYLSLLRPLLRREPPERETLSAETLVEALCQEVALQGAPRPVCTIDAGARPLSLARDDLHTVLVSLCLAFENRDAPSLCVRAGNGQTGLTIELALADVCFEKEWATQDPPRGSTLVLRLVAALMACCEVDFRVENAAPAVLSWHCSDAM